MNMTAVQFQFGLTGTTARTAAATAAATLTAQALAHALQAGQAVAQEGQLGLQFAFVGDGTAPEDLQNQHSAVDDLHATQRGGDVPDLASGQLAVKDGTFRTQILSSEMCFFQLAAAEDDAGLRRGTLLRHLRHSFHVVGFAQSGKLGEAAFAVPKPLIEGQQNDFCRGSFYQNIVKFAQSRSFLNSS